MSSSKSFPKQIVPFFLLVKLKNLIKRVSQNNVSFRNVTKFETLSFGKCCDNQLSYKTVVPNYSSYRSVAIKIYLKNDFEQLFFWKCCPKLITQRNISYIKIPFIHKNSLKVQIFLSQKFALKKFCFYKI